MTVHVRPWLRAVGTSLLIAGYAALAHYSNTASAPHVVGALVAAAPPFSIAAVLAWRAPQRTLALAGLAAVAALTVLLWPSIQRNYSKLLLLQQAGMWAVLSATFARTLLPGRKALCTVWADRVHGPLTNEVVRYTRTVTAVWASFFALTCITSTILYFLARPTVWSLFENFLVLPLIGGVFLGEYAVRRIVLPQLRNVEFLAAVRAFSNHR
jgi:uncharacterized membrane protein